MTEFRIDPQSPVEIEVRAESPAVFAFIAQYRVPGRDYADFASRASATRLGEGAYRIVLRAPIQSYTDLRISFLVDGPANRANKFAVRCFQGGTALGEPIICNDTIGKDGKIVFETAEATFVV